MRKVTKLLLVSTLSTGLVGGVLSVAPAYAKGSKAKFCKAALTVGKDVTNPGDATTITEENAAALEKSFKKLSKLAPSGKLKSATKTIASFYGRIADGDSVEDVSTDDGEAYAKASGVFATYLATKCIAESIPDITLPGGGEVSIPGA